MTARVLMAVLTLILLAAPLPAGAQPAGKVWRIGLMGYGSRPANVLLFLSALEQLLAEQGFRFTRGAAIAAANEVYSSSASAG